MCSLAGCGSRAREMRPTMPSVGFGDEHRRVRVAAHGAEVAALLGGAPPLAVGDEPAFLLGPDGARKLDERGGVAGGRPADVRAHATTRPAPPRRGSPAASSSPLRPTTAAAPPK